MGAGEQAAVNLTAKKCMCLWSLLVAVGVMLIVFIGMMLFYNPGRSSGVTESGSHAVHAPR